MISEVINLLFKIVLIIVYVYIFIWIQESMGVIIKYGI